MLDFDPTAANSVAPIGPNYFAVHLHLARFLRQRMSMCDELLRQPSSGIFLYRGDRVVRHRDPGRLAHLRDQSRRTKCRREQLGAVAGCD